jgi:hypothetical protein
MDTVLQDLGEVLGSYDYSTINPDIDGLAIFTGFFVIMLLLALFLCLINYVYSSLTLYKIAQKLKAENPWLAWIPLVKYYLQLELADMSPAFLALYFAPIVFGFLSVLPVIGLLFNFLVFFASIGVMVVNVISFMNISEKRGYEKLLGLMAIYPLTSYILLGILAWGDKGK